MNLTDNTTALAYRRFDSRSLQGLVSDIAGRVPDWASRVRLSTEERWYERLHQDDEYEVWLISWMPGQATGLHDHGGSRGAFAIALGALEERSMGARPMSGARPARAKGAGRARLLRTGQSRGFGANYIHDVRNISAAPAVSVHAYSPPLSLMHRYDVDKVGRLVELPAESSGDW